MNKNIDVKLLMVDVQNFCFESEFSLTSAREMITFAYRKKFITKEEYKALKKEYLIQ